MHIHFSRKYKIFFCKKISLFFLPFSLFSANQEEPAGREIPLLEEKHDTLPVKSNLCAEDYQHIRLALRHIEGTGVGYNQGYTTLEGLFLPRPGTGYGWIPFLDLRGHIFNNGRLAFNGGVGIRYLKVPRIWGINAYYDYRNTKHQNYNQFAIGLESLGEIVDFRINGYIPFGKKEKSFDSQRQFYKFEDHYLILSKQQEFAMWGGNFEIGIHVDHWKEAPIYLASGPYFVKGNGETGWGGELRASIDLFDYLKLEGKTSYDNIFKWTGQGLIGLTFSFGKKGQIQKKTSCSSAVAMQRRRLQSIDRNEIIPLHTKHQQIKAMNPETNLPYFFWFVDNTSHSQGTFESPYPNLWQAENSSLPGDIIYVFSGNGSTYLVNSSPRATGLQLKNNQKLWGSGISHNLNTQLGLITIPVFSESLPTLTSDFNAVGNTGSVVNLANSCEVAGMNIVGTNLRSGISGGVSGPINNASILNNQIQISRTSVGDIFGILIGDSSQENNGVFVVSNNLIRGINATNGASSGIRVNPSIGTSTNSISNNLVTSIISSQGDANGIHAEGSLSGSHLFSISNNQISDVTGYEFGLGISAYSTGSSKITASIFNNTIETVTSSTLEARGCDLTSFNTSEATFSVYNNTISDVTGLNSYLNSGIVSLSLNSSKTTTNIFNNTIENVICSADWAQGIYLLTANSSEGRFSVYNNYISDITSSDQYATGLETWGTDSSKITGSIFNNNIEKITCSAADSFGMNLTLSNSSEGTLAIENNTISQLVATNPQGIFISTDPDNTGSTIPCLTLKNNNCSASIQLFNYALNTFNLNSSNENNTPSPTQTGVFGTCNSP